MAWVHAVIDVPARQHSAAAQFWSAALGWPVGQAWPGHPELRSFEPAAGSPYLHLQSIDGPPRVHLDLESAQPDTLANLALSQGAALVAEQDDWRTLQSPGGLPFCMVPASERRPPSPLSWPDGHRSRMVQVCIDSPAPVHLTEVAFWRAVLGRRWVESGGPEFAGKWHDDAGSPLQLLFQQLEEAAGPVRAHLDQGTDDVAAEVRRLVDLGADEVGPGRGWHVLRDVTGMAFCVTGNSPELTEHRDLG